MARGGASTVTDALVAELRDLGGEVVTGHRVDAIASLPSARAVLLDRDAAPVDRHCRRPTAQPRSPPRDPLPLRAWRVQGRLGPGWAGALDGSGTPACGDGPSRRDARGDRGQRGGRSCRPAPRTAVCPVRPVRPVGSVAGTGLARRSDDGLGVLPRAVRIDCRHDRAHRGPGGALCAGVPRPDHRAGRTRAGGDGGSHNPNYVGGDINGGHRRHSPVALPAVACPRPVSGRSRPLPVLVVDTAGRRRPRHERLPCRALGLRHELR